MSNKLRVAVFFGGRSAEHEVSLQSAKNVVNALDKNKYDVVLVGLDRDGRWFLENATPALQHNAELTVTAPQGQQIVLEGSTCKQFIGVTDKQLQTSFDVAFPVLHGPNGEDGTIQGLLQLANIPFVGPGILSSALCMDKDCMKRMLRDAGLPIAHFVKVQKHETNIDYAAIAKEVGLPCFVKPANMGSSVGVSKVKTLDALAAAIENAFRYDTKVLVETFIPGREIECAILGNTYPKASIPGEIAPTHEFYSYEAKYLDAEGARLMIPAELTPSQIERIQKIAIQAFQALECEGMARVDLFLTPDDKIYINELNTIPGFTRISMYPKLWEASGLGYSELLDELIRLAMERFDNRQQLQTTRF
jgi:D-alanine-D-alanine ligase